MNSAINIQISTHGRGRALPLCGMGSCRASIPGRQSGARRVSSSLAAVSQLGRSCNPPRGTGRFFVSTAEILEFMALTRAGLRAEVALANLSQPAGQLCVQTSTDLPEVNHVSLSKFASFDDLEATDGENGRVPNQRGMLPDQRGELPNVGDR